jgi:hypothetical protein
MIPISTVYALTQNRRGKSNGSTGRLLNCSDRSTRLIGRNRPGARVSGIRKRDCQYTDHLENLVEEGQMYRETSGQELQSPV